MGKTTAVATTRPQPPESAPRIPGAAARPPRRERRPLWLMLPAGSLLVLVILVPFMLALWMSFLELDQYTLRQWIQAPLVGLANYAEALNTSGLLHSIWASTAFSVLTTLIAAPLGILAALTVNGRFRGRGAVRSIYLVPYVLPSFVTGTLWRIVLQPAGAVNHLLGDLGLGGDKQWLIGGQSFWTLVGVDVWASWAFIYLMALSGLQTISRELYEAAALDGTGWWQRIRYVVLPQIKGPLSLGLLLATLHHFNNFTLPFVLFGMPAPDAVNLLPMNIYQTSFQSFRFGLGAAMSVVTLIIMTIPAVAYLRSSRLDASPQEVEA
ncbi:carbohydrate ABC transporter permease [Streptomyces chiangmaiensis]|uniref:Sugar ABC transporter permease n=1 Tax=Streptomyces chiangmaiensis TaxID=766497 RepID=A0ABU7FMW6_9ACTN|nr:sugar ABC transporter permease [Streptomyces chiangmaiensis]MED7825158.1 sugar ABC transporter permease [Streptomyces chiangmaiensis]